MNENPALQISRYDDFMYDITLEVTNPNTGVTSPLTTGVVRAHVSAWPPSLTPLGPTQTSLVHVGGGRWVEGVDAAGMAAAFTSLPDGESVAVVYEVQGTMVRYREAQVAGILRSEALGRGV